MTDFLHQIAQLESELFPDDAWTADSIAELLHSDINHSITLEKDGNLLGYCLYQIVFETAEILRIGVSPMLQNQGVGTQIFNQLLAVLKQSSVENLMLEVREDNGYAINFYKKQGFTTIHTRKNYYLLSDGKSVDSLIMQKILN